jgi:hypothetical protein
MLVHDRSWNQHGRLRWHEGLWRRRLVAQRPVRTQGVVEAPPALDSDPGLGERVEDLAIEQFIVEPGVEGLDEAILPWAARLDIGCLGIGRSDSISNSLGHELWPVVGTNVGRHAAQYEQVGQDIYHVSGLQHPVDADRQTLMRELVDDVQHAVLSPPGSPQSLVASGVLTSHSARFML